MSWRATAWVKRLSVHPDGTPLSAREKLLLFVLADYHNDDRDCAWAGLTAIARDSLTSRRHLQTLLSRLETKGTLRIERRAQNTNLYRFAGLGGEATSPPREVATARAGEIAAAPEPSLNRHKPKPPVVPLPGGQTKIAPQEIESLFHWGGGYVGVFSDRKRRLLTESERSSLSGSRPEQMVDLLRRKGFRARVVPPDEVATWEKASA